MLRLLSSFIMLFYVEYAYKIPKDFGENENK